MSWKILFAVIGVFAVAGSARAEGPVVVDEQSGIEELDPFAPGVEQYLEGADAVYEAETGEKAFNDIPEAFALLTGCYHQDCSIFVDVDKSSQTLRLYVDGRYTDQWLVSTGISGRDTPDFNQRFNGRIYDRFTSNKYPGGDYRGLGNMPYAMFISGGFAIHGTPEGNWRYLGRRASHGCIRVHPDNAYRLNRMLRRVGVQNSWVSVHD